MAPSSPLLEARKLTVGVAGKIFCRDLDFALAAGERLAILGRNGAGKSTLLSVLAGLRAPLSGEVRVKGASYAEHGGRRSALIRDWLPQSRGDAFASTVLETVLVGRHPHLERWGWESAQDAQIVRRALAAVDLMGLALRSVMLNRAGQGTRAGDDSGVASAGQGGPDPLVAGMRAVLASDESGGVRVHELATAPAPLDRPARLRKLGVVLDAPSGRGHGTSTAQVSTLSGTGLDSRFEMVWRQRLPDPDTLGLGRAGDDLLPGFALPDGAVCDGVGNQRGALGVNLPGADGVVTDFGVAHVIVRRHADRGAVGAQLDVRVVGEEPVEGRLAGGGNRAAHFKLGNAVAVHDDDDDRALDAREGGEFLQHAGFLEKNRCGAS